MFNFRFWRRTKVAEAVSDQARKPGSGLWSTDEVRINRRDQTAPQFNFNLPEPQAVAGVAMDSTSDGRSPKSTLQYSGVSEALLEWYVSQAFIGYSTCALIAQHWLVDKCCSMPARDAIRQGYTVDVGDDKTSEQLRKLDNRYRVDPNMVDLVSTGRVYGVRYVIFDVMSMDPLYYTKPFNLDGVLPGSYRGMRQVDPQWVTPELTHANCDPADPHFYKPEFFVIGGRRYHRSHLHIFIPYPVTDILKPTYKYGGVSVPQRIYERVYASERTANEAPQLAMTKRLTTFQASEGADLAAVLANMADFAEVRNNYGVMLTGPGETVGQFETALADFDTLLMTQYQLVASSANVPATKLLGTQPKGFNATGDYEESVYREELESIQTSDLSPLLKRHYSLAAKSNGIEYSEELTIQWAPLDSPTATEWADISLKKAQTDQLYFAMQAIDGVDVRDRLRQDREGDYFGLAPDAEETTGEEDGQAGAAEAAQTAMGGIPSSSNQGDTAQLPGTSTGTLPVSP